MRRRIYLKTTSPGSVVGFRNKTAKKIQLAYVSDKFEIIINSTDDAYLIPSLHHITNLQILHDHTQTSDEDIHTVSAFLCECASTSAYNYRRFVCGGCGGVVKDGCRMHSALRLCVLLSNCALAV